VAFRKIHSRDKASEYLSNRGMETSVRPAADGVYRGVLPCLEPVVVVEVVCWLPEIEDFVTVLDWAIEGGNDVADEEDVEGYDSRELKWSLLRSVGVSRHLKVIAL
jgi:hypothetical protein